MAAGLLALVLTTAIPPRTIFLGLLNNAGHAPIFGFFALIVLYLAGSRHDTLVPGTSRYAFAFAVTIMAGAGVEIVQFFTGRDASWGDLAMDASGAAVALGLAGALEAGRRRRGRFAAGILVASAGAALVLAPLVDAGLSYARRKDVFPAIATFDQPRDLYFIEGSGASIARATIPVPLAENEDAQALRITLDRAESPGVRHNEPAPDWRDYRVLRVDLANPGDVELNLMLRIHDAPHDQRHVDRFNLAFSLPPRTRRVLDIKLEVIANAPAGRRLDLGQIAGIVLFERSRPAPVGATFYLAGMWLE
jgi:hypothetical protein